MIYLQYLLRKLLKRDEREEGAANVKDAENLVADTMRVLERRKRVYLFRVGASERGPNEPNTHGKPG